MNEIDIFIIIYLLLSFLISFAISFFFLNYFRNTKFTSIFTFYFSTFCICLAIFEVFLVILDHSLSSKPKQNNNSLLIDKFFTILELYYEYFGYFCKFISIFFSPLMIFYHTTGYYRNSDILLDIFARLGKEIFSLFNIILISLGLVSFLVLLYFGKALEFYHSYSKLILNFLNYYSFLQTIFYLGFMIQSFYRMTNLYKNDNERDNYDIWRLGKIYLYYERLKHKIEAKFNEIQNEIEEYSKEHLNEIEKEFFDNYEKFKIHINNCLLNIINIEPDIEGVKLASKKYKKKFIENIENKDNLNDQLNEKSYDINNNEEIEYLEKNSEACRKQLKKYDKFKKCLILSCCCSNKKEKQKRIYKNFTQFKNVICNLMGEVYENCVSIQRKSFLINLKAEQLFGKEIRCKNCIYRFRTFIFFFFLFILILLELPFSINYFYFLNDGNLSDYIKIIIIFFVFVVLYFIIFTYSIIHHKYIEGELLFGKKQSQNVNYYYFLIEILTLCNVLIFHSVWALNKENYLNAKFRNVYIILKIIIREGSTKEIPLDLISFLSFLFIYISIYIAFSFSKIKICGKILIFNESSDFFGFDENFYGNFYLGCGCLIFIAKNGIALSQDKKINKNGFKEEKKKDLYLKEEEQKEPLIKNYEEEDDLILFNDNNDNYLDVDNNNLDNNNIT